jgi:aerobic C4-dicarboxylate transport protein
MGSLAVPGPAAPGGTSRRPRFTRQLYFWVLLGILAGIVVGGFFPDFGAGLKPLGDTFVNAIKMIITPVIFITVVAGIAGVAELRGVGRIGGKALIYFEAVTTLALILGLVVMNLLKPGQGVDAVVPEVSATVAGYVETAESQSTWHLLTDVVPDSVVGAFAEGEILQVLFFAILFGLAVKAIGTAGEPIARGVDNLGLVIFRVLKYIMYAAPVGAFGAMAFTVGEYGLDTLTSLGKLIAVFYGTSVFFVLVVLGTIAKLCGVNIFKLLRYLKDELLIVLGTSSSETVLPQLMRKLEHLGAPRQVVGLTVPTGYSFNLDGTCIYLTLAALYIAQAQNVDLGIGAQLGILAVLLLTSKGAAGVTGSGFIVLAATLSSTTIPVAGIMLVFGIDKFMSECRALTNVCGNSVASIVVARWEGVFDLERCKRVLDGDLPYYDDAYVADQIVLPEEKAELTKQPATV